MTVPLMTFLLPKHQVAERICPNSSLGDITADQFRAVAKIQREFDADIRLTNRQNLIIRGLDALPLRLRSHS